MLGNPDLSEAKRRFSLLRVGEFWRHRTGGGRVKIIAVDGVVVTYRFTRRPPKGGMERNSPAREFMYAYRPLES